MHISKEYEAKIRHILTFKDQQEPTELDSRENIELKHTGTFPEKLKDKKHDENKIK